MRRRLGLIVFAVTAMVATAFLLPLAVLVKSVAADRAKSASEQEARSLAGVLAAVTQRSDAAAVVEQLNAGGPRRAAVVFANGVEVGAPIDVPPDRLAQARSGQAFTFSNAGDHVVVVPVRIANGAVTVAVVAVPQSELTRGVRTAWLILVLLGTTIVSFGIVLSDRLARTTVRAIEGLGSVTRRLREGDLSARADATGPDEVADVAFAVNQLAEQIGVLLAAEREANADISHRLRTPLTALQLQAESLPPGPERDRLTEAVTDLTDEVNAVIEEARKPRPARASASSVDLVDLVDQRMAFWSVLATQQQRTLEWVRPGEPVMALASADEVVVALDALLNNVLHHTPEGTAFGVDVTSQDATATLVVWDQGTGLPKAATARGHSGAGSTGLGLDIVRRTAERHGGRLQLLSSKAGTRAVLTFSSAAPPST